MSALPATKMISLGFRSIDERLARRPIDGLYFSEAQVEAALEKIASVAAPGEKNARILSYFRLYEHRLNFSAMALLMMSLETYSSEHELTARSIDRKVALSTIIESLLRVRHPQLKQHELLFLMQIIEDPKRREALRRIYPI